MSTPNKGRSLDQQTRNGTSSIGTWGAGCTGQPKSSQSNSGKSEEGNQQSGRTDDLLSGGVEESQSEHGFQTGEQYRQGDHPEAQQGGKGPERRGDR